MDLAALEAALLRSSEDRSLSRAERKVFGALLSEQAPDVHAVRRLRARAFDIARSRLEGPHAREIVGWLEDTVGLLLHGLVRGAPPPVVAQAHFSPGEDCLAAVVQELTAARRQVDVCVFTITDDRITEGLLGAVRRGVRVRVVSDDDKSSDEGSDLMRLARAGVPVAVDRTPDHMHHKFALFDGARLLTGSFNWTRAASRGNHENLLVTSDERLVGAYQAEFERLWAEFSS